MIDTLGPMLLEASVSDNPIASGPTVCVLRHRPDVE